MHEVIYRLEEAGLIKRNAHPSHRRKRPASLTAKGRKVVATCEAAVSDFETRMLHGFSRADRAKFRAMIKGAVRNLGGGFHDATNPAVGGDDRPGATRRATSRSAA
jgi:DNA-binding MarR family transcriptional regulator